MRLSIGTAFNDPARAIIGYAYDNTGAGIGVGAVTAVAGAGERGPGLGRAGRARLVAGTPPRLMPAPA